MSERVENQGGSILGAAVKRAEDPRFIQGHGRYVQDHQVDGQVWMCPVRSSVPHGRILSIDIDAAIAMPGVIGVYGPDDVQGSMPIDFPGQTDDTRLPLISSGRVRFVGDIVAVVVAETERQARDAAEAVWVDIEPMPVIATPEAALAESAELLFPELGSNIVKTEVSESPDPLDGADVVIRGQVVNQRIAAVPLETNNALAVPVGDGVDVMLGAQQIHGARNAISTALGIDRSLVRVRVPDMGGGFGAKIFTYREHALCAFLARRLNQPVRWNETRTENMIAMNHGRAQRHVFEVGARRDGTIVGMRLDVTQDCGAFPLFGAMMPFFTRRMSSGPYAIPRIDYRARSVVTNTTPVHAYRGAGRPEATVTLERVMDTLAAELRMDPAEVRRRNLQDPEAFPWVTATGERYDSGNYRAALEKALDMAGYGESRREQAVRRGNGDRVQLGIGIASYVEVTAPGGRKDWGAVDVHTDGTATVFSGAVSHGHSHETTFPQLVSRVLGIPIADIGFVQADTASVVRGGGTMGSRSLQMAGSAIHRSAGAVLDKARAIVAHHREAAVEDVILAPDGTIGVSGVPDLALTWAEVASLASDPANLPDGMKPGLRVEDTYEQEHSSVPFGTHVSIVEVDTETGEVTLRRHIAVDDAGLIVNHLVFDGQIHGGIAQGIGQALFEDFRYDDAANPLTGNLTGYLLPTAVGLPAMELGHTHTPSPSNPLGVKGIGEAGTVGSTPAVYGAVLDAVAHLGVGHIDMPLTPGRVWGALTEAKTN
ncbi:MAG: xanthine dehydrogenase family protein molybdopterin-binding subunit [Acidimicrobiia bacterium]|nr:xanthine dehydrogenase family protein molybdopterin-binding subunit [Acidimicrobiia bacterium]